MLRLQKELDTLRLSTMTQQSETQRLTASLAAANQETKELHEELERRDSIIKSKVQLVMDIRNSLF